jgi:hypothetical protein
MDGADIGEVVKQALNAGIIILRKRIKTKEQAEELANGITFAQMVSAAPKDSNSMAASMNVDELDPNVAKALLEKLMAKVTD